MPAQVKDPDPQVTSQALAEYIRAHGAAIARDELARWDLHPRLERHPSGAAELTALHDPDGNPAVRYRLAANGQLTLNAASHEQPLPQQLMPPSSYNPAKPHKATPLQSAILSKHVPTGCDHHPHYLVVTPLTIATLMWRQLTLRVIASAAATASELIPHRAVRHAISPNGTRPVIPPKPSPPMEAARSVALTAILETADSQEHLGRLERRLDPPAVVHSKVNRNHPATGRRSRTPLYDPDRIITVTANQELDTVPAPTDTRPEGHDPISLADQLVFDLTHNLLDREAVDTLLAVHAVPQEQEPKNLRYITVDHYNSIQAALGAYRRLLKQDHGSVRLYLTQFSTPSEKPRSPQVLLKRLRNNMRVNDTQWAIFRRLANNPQLAHSTAWGIRTLARAATLAGRPEADDDRLVLLNQAEINLSAVTDDNRKTPAREAWGNTLSAFLDPAEEMPSTKDLEKVIGAMTQSVDDGIPWPPVNWPRMVKEAYLWLEQLLAGERPNFRNFVYYELAEDTPWSEYTRSGYTLTPLNTSNRQTAATYLLDIPPLQRGREDDPATSRTFLARGPGRDPAAIRITREGRTWKPDGITVARGQRAGRHLDTLAESLAAAASAHQRRQPTPPAAPDRQSSRYLYAQMRRTT